MRRALISLPAVVLLLSAVVLPAQQIKEMQFVNQPITDILLALGEVSGRSIIPDETVSGAASYYFTQTDFDTALQVFLSTYKMYYRREEGVYYVSRIRTDYDPVSRVISMDAEDVEIQYLIRAASKAMDKTILYDPLPAQSLTVHVTRISPDKLLEILIRRFADYNVEADQDYFYIRRVPQRPAGPAAGRPGPAAQNVQRLGDRYSVDVEKARFQELIDELFSKAELEYSMLARKDVILDRLRFQDKSFETMLRLILEQASADYARVGEVFYIFEIQQRDVLKKLNTTVRLPLTYIAAKELTTLLPADLLSAQLFKIDVTHNAVILSGSVEEIGPVQQFIRAIDQPVSGRSYHLFRLNYLNATKIQAVLPPDYRHIEPVVIPESNAFVALLSDQTAASLAGYLAMVDKPAATVAVKLKYLRAEDLVKKLPPSIGKDEVVETADPSVVFVRASPEKLEDFYRDLRILDKPVPQIHYQFLVIQYKQGESLNWSDSLQASLGTGSNAFLGTLGRLLNLSFDVVSTFGVQFALSLSTDLSRNKAKILADTGLIGLSGQELNFQNTETFRYQEVEVDENGVMRFTGVTREITSGLIFKIQGWVSGDGMITMDVKATVSKRGTVPSSTVGALPPTSEHVVNTRARTFSGEPVVIGGLMRQEKDIEGGGVPFLGDIPLLGYLFRSEKDSMDNTELVIYVVPRVVHGEVEEADVGMRMERLYEKFLGR